MCQLTPELFRPVAFFIDDIGGLAGDRAEEPSRFLHFFRAVSHDLFPGIGMRDGQFIGSHAHDVAISSVQVQHIERKRARHIVVGIGNAGDGVRHRAGEPTERMKEDVVNRMADEVHDDLPVLSTPNEGFMCNSFFS